MFLQKLLNQGNAPLLEQVVHFAAQRHRLIAENIANVDTPHYRQKDLSVEGFQNALRQRVDLRRRGGSPSFNDIGSEVMHPRQNILFHDGNNRSMETLASDMAKNALMHNVAIEMLKKQYGAMEMALRERIA